MRLLIARGVADRWKGLCLDGVTPSFHATPFHRYILANNCTKALKPGMERCELVHSRIKLSHHGGASINKGGERISNRLLGKQPQKRKYWKVKWGMMEATILECNSHDFDKGCGGVASSKKEIVQIKQVGRSIWGGLWDCRGGWDADYSE
ncbi:unnamed protein product [Sphenostylis stenocarpa]|uniref:Uncharacterized protein n=1 Tax=Sphenostylis stenocarpa TaxID=92480 RepID=A0AA86W1N3_9FABA|nr:unnamed protein product [Sphenostylis stenocarpa]